MDFELLNNLTKDYVLIVEVLIVKLKEKIINHNDKIYVDREIFFELLSKKDFMLPQEKMKIWRRIGWNYCDNDRSRYTIMIRIGDKTLRKIVIEKEPYKTIKNIIMNVGTRVGT